MTVVPVSDIGGTRFDTRVVVVIIFALLYAPMILNYGIGYRDGAQIDLEPYYWASVVTFEQERSPYGPEAFAGIESDREGSVNPFWYPPPSLLAFYPLSWFSYNVARIGALVLNHLLLIVFLWLLVFRVLRLKWRPADVPLLVITSVLALTYHPILSTICQGQVNLAAGVCLLLFWTGLRDDAAPAAVAIPLALAILLKSYPIAFLALMLYRRKYRSLSWTIGMLGAVALIAWAVLPAVVWSDWLTKIAPGGGYGVAVVGLESPAAPWNQSLNALTSRLFMDSSHSGALLPSLGAARLVPYLLSLAVVAITTLVVVRNRSRQRPGERLDLQMALMLSVLFLIAPFAWEHHGVFVLPSILIGFRCLLPVWKEHLGLFVPLVISAGIMTCYLPLHLGKLASGPLTLLISIKLYAVLTLWLVLLAILNQTDRPQKTTLA